MSSTLYNVCEVLAEKDGSLRTFVEPLAEVFAARRKPVRKNGGDETNASEVPA